MIEALHGKRYYMEFNTNEWDACIKTFDALAESGVLENEPFYIQLINGKYVIYSEASCTSFRGPKYREWERIKAKAYRLKRVRRA